MLDRIRAFLRGSTKPLIHSPDAPIQLVRGPSPVIADPFEMPPHNIVEVGLILKRAREMSPDLSDLDLANKIGHSVDYVRKALIAVDKV